MSNTMCPAFSSSGTTFHGAKVILGGRSISRMRSDVLNRAEYDSLDGKLIRAVCAGGLGLNPAGVHAVHGGKRSCLYCIEAENGDRFALKIFNIDDHHGPGHELLFAGVAGLSVPEVPVPDIFMVNISGELTPYPYSFSSWLRGDSVKNQTSVGLLSGPERIFEHMGRLLGSIHSAAVQMKGFGAGTADCIRDFIISGKISGPVVGEYGTAAERYIRPARREASFLFRNAVIDRGDRDAVMTVLDGGVPEDDDIVFQHGDVSMGNFLSDGSSITGILDGAGMIGFRHDELSDVYLSLHALEFYFPGFSAREAFDGFVRGYHVSSGREIINERFIFFCVANAVEHLSVLVKKGRSRYIGRFVDFLSTMLNRQMNPVT
jgi:hypothetical protein